MGEKSNFLPIVPLAWDFSKCWRDPYKKITVDGEASSLEATNDILKELFPIEFNHPNTYFVVEGLDENGNFDPTVNSYILGKNREIVDNKVVFRGVSLQDIPWVKMKSMKIKAKQAPHFRFKRFFRTK
ncbi:hypothetical protein SAMN05446037_106410 [Anaerovirgula multivorans]|uniref:Uncharacterized protein n=1 Tax=Anaerovirgula multivorans TaxID=312168 RepID=A0A239L5U7_9FIRM|nr:hypothetical protein [Anaerovirgula multivorans]SNT25821.1 hypothetical protein SAMN05446037_106410 [Anaerovirgula multivorans]